MCGWIKLHRKLLNWEWYSDIPCRVLFLHLLIKVNYEDSKYQGVVIKAGSCAAGYPSLADQTGLTIQQIRTAMKKLISTNEITVNKQPKFSVITLNKWIDHQQDNSQSTGDQQASNSQSTTSKEVKKKEKKKKEYTAQEQVWVDEFNKVYKTELRVATKSRNSESKSLERWIDLRRNEMHPNDIIKAWRIYKAGFEFPEKVGGFMYKQNSGYERLNELLDEDTKEYQEPVQEMSEEDKEFESNLREIEY